MNNKLEEISREIKKYGIRNNTIISNPPISIIRPIKNKADGLIPIDILKQMELEVNKISNQLDALKLWIDNDVEAAKNNYRNALATMDMQQQNKELAEKVYQQTKKKYEVGTGTQIEIVAAQTEMKSAQTNYISALYDAIIAKVDYLKATGKL